MKLFSINDDTGIFNAVAQAAEGRGIEHIELFGFRTESYTVEAKDGGVDFLQRAQEHGLALRLLGRQQLGFSYTTDLSEPALQQLVLAAWEGAQVLPADPLRFFPLVQDLHLPSLHEPPSDLDRYTEADKIALALDLERTALAYDKRIRRVRKSTYQEAHKQVWLKTSRGGACRTERRLAEIGVMAMAEDQGQQEMSWDMDFNGQLARLRPREIAEKVAAEALALLGARPIATIRCPVVLDREVVCSLLGVLSSSFLADHVQKGKSALAGKMGQELYSKSLHIVDDGVRPGGYESFPFDGEGMIRQRTPLVVGGVLQGFLYDTYTAAKANAQTTGNALRPTFKESPQLGTTNFFIEPGLTSRETLAADLDHGLWIVDVIGIHTANPISGDFSVGAAGFWYEQGKRQFPVRGIALSGNLHQIFRDVEAVGSDLKFYRGIGAPSLRIGTLDISGK